MRKLNEREKTLQSAAFARYHDSKRRHVSVAEHQAFSAAFIAALDHAAAETANLLAEIDRLRAAQSAWKKAAKRHRHNERRKQKALEWGLAEIDRLRAALDRIAAGHPGYSTQAELWLSAEGMADVARQALEAGDEAHR